MVIDITGTSQSCIDDGMATVTVTGGVGPYEYQWSNGAITAIVSNLIAGTYTVIVTDINGCTATASIVIASPIDLEVSSTFTNCNMSDGTATATVLGGANDPTFAWSNGATGTMITDLAPDWYSVTVTDEDTGCKVHRNVEVLEDPICFVIISGYVYVDDENQDCIIDGTTLPAANVMVECSDGQIVFTNADGYYEFGMDAGTYDIMITYPDNIFDGLCDDPITVVATEWGTTYGDNNFYLLYGEQRDIELKVVKPNARPGFTQKVRICLMNRGAVPVSGTLTFVHSDVQDFNQASPNESNYDMTTQTLTWEYEEIPPNTTWVYNIYLYTPIGTPLGTPLDYHFIADPIAGDLTPDNNEIICTEEVTGSYDPNDKAVTPAGQGPEGIISMADTLLSYRIRFQNTGTDTAFTVLIRDTLNEHLEVSSIIPGPSSHGYVASIKEGNVLELLFENILLPDSFVNEPASNGFVIFDIKLKPNRTYGTEITNSVGIYFDFNEPVITNTVINTIQMIPTSSNDIESLRNMELFPNPIREETVLRFTLEEQETVRITVLDLLGQELKLIEENVTLNSGEHQIAIKYLDFPQGVYYLNLQTLNGDNQTIKMLKLE